MYNSVRSLSKICKKISGERQWICLRRRVVEILYLFHDKKTNKSNKRSFTNP